MTQDYQYLVKKTTNQTNKQKKKIKDLAFMTATDWKTTSAPLRVMPRALIPFAWINSRCRFSSPVGNLPLLGVVDGTTCELNA